MTELENCPVCDKELNHVIDNGYRNEWPLSSLDDDQQLAVCTDETNRMFVHVYRRSATGGNEDAE